MATRERKMITTQKEMMDAKVPLKLRDYCAHLFIPLTQCRKDNYYLPWRCKKEKHAWEECEYHDYLERIRQKRLEKKQQEQQSK